MATLTNFSSLWMNLIMTQQKISKVLNKLRPNVIEGYHSKLGYQTLTNSMILYIEQRIG